MKKKILATIGILVILLIPLRAQIVFEPLDHGVYGFLDRLSQKGIIEFDDLVKPLPRKYIYEKLAEAEKEVNKLTALEKDELKYYEKDYFFEKTELNHQFGNKKYKTFLNKDSAGRYRLFSYGDKLFKLNVSPILGYRLTLPGNERNVNTWNGFYAYGYFSNFLGYSMDVRVHNESGSYIDAFKYFTPETGIIPNTRYPSTHENSIDYSEVKGMLSYDWDWGDLVFAKDYITYGYAQSGNLVLSTKAPSYPYIRLDLHPVKWLAFHYFHAWLASDVIDSLNFIEGQRNIYRNKYFTWHSLVVTPTKGLDLSVGESVIYADQLEPVYLMPFMFYFLADDFLSNRYDAARRGDANSQIFFSVSSRDHIKDTHLYGTMFIDELTLAGLTGTIFSNNRTTGSLFHSPRNRTQLGFTLGCSVTDMPINNLTITTEYTRINPFVYQHHDPAQTYTNAGYIMGDWIGPNSDLAYLNLNYIFFRGFQMNIWGEYIRKGSDSDSLQYASTQPDFLYGLKNYYKYFGVTLKYQPIHELNIELGYRTNGTSSEQNDGSYIDNQIRQFSFAVYYGL